MYLKAIKKEYFVSKEERKNKVDLSKISFFDVKKISKYYKKKSKEQRKTSNKGKVKKISLEPKMEELENLILI